MTVHITTYSFMFMSIIIIIHAVIIAQVMFVHENRSRIYIGKYRKITTQTLNIPNADLKDEHYCTIMLTVADFDKKCRYHSKHAQ